MTVQKLGSNCKVAFGEHYGIHWMMECVGLQVTQ
jgi:hypothetical protein